MRVVAHHLSDHLVLKSVISQHENVACRSVVTLLLEAVRVAKSALLQAQLLALTIHLIRKSFYIVLVAFIWELERLLHHFLKVVWPIRKIVDFSFPSKSRHLCFPLLVSNEKEPPPKLSGEDNRSVVARGKHESMHAVVDRDPVVSLQVGTRPAHESCLARDT